MFRIIAAWFLTCMLTFPAHAGTESASAMDRIRANKEIRCGYNVYSPYLRKDANTGELSGIFYDIMEQIGKNADIKIIWAEEAGRGDIFTGLDAGRYDVWCSGLWANASRALAGSFSRAAFYSVVTAWVRGDETRFLTLSDLQKNGAVISSVDGSMDDLIAQSDYPDLKRITLPQLASSETSLQNIVTGKADVTFAEPSMVTEFLSSNPGTLRSLGANQALRIFGNTLGARAGDSRTQEFLNAAIDELVFSGTVDRILKKYESGPGIFLRVARPFALPEEK